MGTILSDAAVRPQAFAPAGTLGPEPEGRARLAAVVGAASRVLLDSDAAWAESDRAAAAWCLRAVALHPDGAAAIRGDPAAAVAAERLAAGASAASARCGPGRRLRGSAHRIMTGEMIALRCKDSTERPARRLVTTRKMIGSLPES